MENAGPLSERKPTAKRLSRSPSVHVEWSATFQFVRRCGHRRVRLSCSRDVFAQVALDSDDLLRIRSAPGWRISCRARARPRCYPICSSARLAIRLPRVCASPWFGRIARKRSGRTGNRARVRSRPRNVPTAQIPTSASSDRKPP